MHQQSSNENSASGIFYDEDIIHQLEAISNRMISGIEPTYTLEQTIENIVAHRKHQPLPGINKDKEK